MSSLAGVDERTTIYGLKTATVHEEGGCEYGLTAARLQLGSSAVTFDGVGCLPVMRVLVTGRRRWTNWTGRE